MVVRACAIVIMATTTVALALGSHTQGMCGEVRPLSLQQAVEMALAREVLVREAEQGLATARAQLVRARAYTPRLSTGLRNSASSSAGLDPESTISGTDYSSQSYTTSLQVPMRGGMSVGLSTSASTSTTNSVLRTGEEDEFTYAGAYVGASVSRRLGLFRDERVLTEGGRWSAELGVRGAELALEEAGRQVVGGALTHFFLALRAQRRAEIAEASGAEAQELLRIAQAKFERGKLAGIEAMEARVAADSAGVAQRQAQAAAASALDSLKDFLGIPLEEPVRLVHEEATAAASDPESEAELMERALVQRADLQQSALGVRLAELAVRQTEAESRPGTYLTGGYSRSGQGETVSESFDQLVNPSWYVGMSLSMGLTGAEDRAVIEQVRGSLRLARLNEQLRRDQVRLELRRLRRELENAAANAAVLADTVKMAEENLHIRRVQFEHGLVRPIDVTQTESQLTQARLQLLDAVIAADLAAAGLSMAVGEMPELAGAGR